MTPINHAFTARKKILIIDCDETLGQDPTKQIEYYDNYLVSKCSMEADALQQMEKQCFDLVLLDVGLAVIEGREICKLIRRRDRTMPIIMRAAAKNPEDEILCLDAGANDYLRRSCRISILLARIRAHLRQYDHLNDAELMIGPYIFRPGVGQMIEIATERCILLTMKESAVLKLAYRNNGDVIRREVLLQRVWGYKPGVHTHTVESLIYRLRRKIERDPANPTLLVTKSGGYQLIR